MNKKMMLFGIVAMAFLFMKPVDAWIYQETANAISYNGSCYGAFPCSNAYDSDWSTEASPNGTVNFFLNYTKPYNSTVALWQVKNGANCINGSCLNISVPSDCFSFNQSLLKLRVDAYANWTPMNWYVYNFCWNGSWKLISNFTSYSDPYLYYFYEEGIHWDSTPAIVNCSLGGNSALNFNFYRESNKTVMNGSLDITFAVLNPYGNQSNNYSFSFIPNSTQALCISPSWASYQVNATSVYDAENYSQRHYYLINASITNQTQNINLYLLEDSQSSLIQTQVIDRSINPISDVIIKAQKYYVGSNEYLTVAEGKTDFNGNDYIYLNLYNTWYKFILEKNGQALEEFDPLTIGATTISLPVGNATRGEYWSYYGSVAYTCYYTNATAVLRCDFTDTSGLMQTIVLSVQRYGMVSGFTEFCNQTSTSTSATLLCTLNNTGTQLYKFTLYAIYPNSQFPFFTGDVDLSSKTKTYGDTGVITAMMIIGVVSVAGLPAAVGVLIFTTIAIVLVILIRLLVIENIYYSLLCIVSLVALMIWKLRERRWD